MRGADVVACEDTRVTRTLLTIHGIERPLIAYNDHNAPEIRPRLLAALREGQSVVLVSDAEGIAEAGEGSLATIEMPRVHPLIAPLVYAVPVQLLAYHVAVAKGTDVDQPRNLAKSVTVE